MLRGWDDLPDKMKNEKVLRYYNILKNKRGYLFIKRLLDIVFSLVLLIILFPILLLLGFLIKINSPGPVIFRQTRVTQYGKCFKMLKFRTMINNAEKVGPQITTMADNRITTLGKFLRKLRLDELPQLINIFLGEMSFVGTRPEVVKYVEYYSDEMLATLLLPAGVTSEASILYKNEEMLLSTSNNVDDLYIKTILPRKMEYNLRNIEKYSLGNDCKIIIKTILAMIKKNKSDVIVDLDRKDVGL